MDKNAIKKYAVWARRELIRRVCNKAEQFGIKKDNIIGEDANVVNGIVLSPTQKSQRSALIKKINKKGYDQTMEEVAYTWFNRFCALRFMEVNQYLPNRIRIFTNEKNEFKPQVIDEAIHLEFEWLDMKKIYNFKEKDNNDGLYKYLIISLCNELGKTLPGMFEKISDYTELLFPDNILRDGSVAEQLVSSIPQEDWRDAVQIIGWLYQYYNTEKKDDVFAALKKNVKISKDNIPAATQLFTPDWIVRYMVENSVGRLWLERNMAQDDHDIGHWEDNNRLKTEWKYYLDEAEQEPEVQAQLNKIRKEYKNMMPEEIKIIDPCMGSGHILVYAFDVLMQIYQSCGYSERDAARSVVENNLYGLDIDDRAAQLAYFAVMMKACQYDKRFLTRGIKPNIYAIPESNDIGGFAIHEFVKDDEDLKNNLQSVLDEMHNAKEYGSILNITPVDFELLYNRADELYNHDDEDSQSMSFSQNTVNSIIVPLIKVAEILSQKYDVVITNPPYMGASGMSSNLSKYVKKYYPNSKSDLFAVFIERCGQMEKESRYYAMITQHAWMFLSSYEKLRANMLVTDTVNMAHLGARAFDEIGGEVVQTTAFVRKNSSTKDYKGVYCRLIEPNTQQGKEDMFLAGTNRYIADQSNFSKIPGSPIAYWVSEKFIKAFENGVLLGSIAASKQGIATANNNYYLREWFEVDNTNIKFNCMSHEESEENSKKWYPYNKGGEFRKWYGNNDYVVNWKNDGHELKNDKKAVLRNPNYYFKQCFSWSLISSNVAAFRYKPIGHIFDVAGMSCFSDDKLKYLLAFCNSNFTMEILKVIAPTINYQCGDIANLPVIYDAENKNNINSIVEKNINISKTDWDSYETSWDFKKHPLIEFASFTSQEIADDKEKHISDMGLIRDAYELWRDKCEERFNHLKANEEELNRIFIDIYGLQDELTPEVADKDITVHRVYDTKDDVPESMKGSNYIRTKRDEIVSLISYAVGCMFGRYSLDADGLAYAGGEWDSSKYETFIPDMDNCIPITDDEYFEDDIVGLFCDWLKKAYGEKTLEENLEFIADALDNKGNTSRAVIRNYFLNDFYADHCKIYQKRPIYWLFDSGKKNGFKALIYMHRYREDTIARMRTDYVHEQQSRYQTAIEDAEKRLLNVESSDRAGISKEVSKLKGQDEEVHIYEEKIHHLADQMIRIDLDDGVRQNYEIFKDVLAKIK